MNEGEGEWVMLDVQDKDGVADRLDVDVSVVVGDAVIVGLALELRVMVAVMLGVIVTVDVGDTVGLGLLVRVPVMVTVGVEPGQAPKAISAGSVDN